MAKIKGTAGLKMAELKIEPIRETHRDWVRHVLAEHWGSSIIVTRGTRHDAERLPGFFAVLGGQPAGLVTYRIEPAQCEIVSLNSLSQGIGIGAALVEAVKAAACSNGCKRVWLVATNDNTPALRFYQRRGFRLVAVHRNVIEDSRRLKPQIPLLGLDGIALRDEIELELPLVVPADRQLAGVASGIQVRPCTNNDLSCVATLFARWQAEASVHGLQAEIAEELRPRMGEYFLVAQAAEGIVGFIIGKVQTQPLCVLPAGRPYLEVKDLYVAPEHRRQGIGKALLLALFDAAAKAGVGGFTLYSASKDWQNVLGFYEKAGFRMWSFQMYKDGSGVPGQ